MLVTGKPQYLAELVWSVADLLRRDFKSSEYGSVILPFTVLRRLECVRDSGEFSLKRLTRDASVTADSVLLYIGTLSDDVREVMYRYGFDSWVRRLEHVGVLRHVVATFADLDLRPEVVSDRQMSNHFEELLRRDAERSTEN